MQEQATPTYERARASLLSAFDLLTDKDLAVLLDVKPMTLLHWRRKGLGPDYVKLGGSIFYRRTAVVEWIAAQETVVDRAHKV